MSILISRINSQSNNPNKDNELSLITEPPYKVITGQIDEEEYGLFGDCYSQPQDFVDLLCEQTSGTFYDIHTPEHEVGQWTVDIVLCALNVLPKVKAWQTPHNSDADVKWKWDVIIEHEGYLYPVQIKSSLDAIKECKQKFRENLGIVKEKISERKYKIKEIYDNQIQRYKESNKLKSSKDANIVGKIKRKNQEIEKLNNLLDNFIKARPLYIWTARDEDSIKALVGVFSKLFLVPSDVLELQAQAVKQYHNKYKNIQEILVEAEQAKLNTINEIIDLIKQYLDLSNNYLTENALININNNKPKRLEDILTIKKAENLLNLAENMLIYYNKSFSFAQDSYDDKMVAQDNQTLIEFYKIQFKQKGLKNIQRQKVISAGILDQKVTHIIRQSRKNQRNKETDIEELANLVASQEQRLIKNSYLQYIEPQTLMECLDKLQEFESKSSYSQPEILGKIKNKITYIVAQEVTLKSETIPEWTDLNSIYF